MGFVCLSRIILLPFIKIKKGIDDDDIHLAGSHCLDILKEKETDPEWLIKQRKIEVKIIKRWMAKYYAELKSIQTTGIQDEN